MSPFNFETFGAGHIPPFPKFVFDIKEGKSKLQTTLSEDIEDVEYVDVSDAPQAFGNDTKKFSYDKKVRAKDIVEYAEKKSRQFNEKKDPLLDVFFLVAITIGAQWADDNPKSKFATSMARTDTFHAEIEKIWKDSGARAEKTDRVSFLMFLMSASLGMKWATNNPPKYY